MATDMIKIRIPTTQYGYLEVDFEGTSDEAIDEHNRLLKVYAGGEGIESKEFDAWLDKYLVSQKGELEIYQKMSIEQQAVIQILKRSFARIKSKLPKLIYLN